MIKEIREEVCLAIEEVYNAAFRADYIASILLIGRAEVFPGLKAVNDTDCVIEYTGDIFLDETRSQYYLDYLRKNYSREGYSYPFGEAVSDITSELTIYSHLWDSDYFMKSLYRLSAIISGKGYLWKSVLPTKDVHISFRDNVILPLKDQGFQLGAILEETYKPSIRNAFAHSRYAIDETNRRIDIWPRSGHELYSFDEFQRIFLYSAILMNKMQNYQEENHNIAAKKNTALTEPFFTPDGVKVQVFGEMVRRGDELYPEFRMARIID